MNRGKAMNLQSSMSRKNTILRLLKTMTGKYKGVLVLVFFLIIVSAAANVQSSVFVKSLIDDYIAPLLLTDNPNFSGLVTALILMGVFYLIGALSTFFYNRAMVDISQGVLKKIRDEMFAHMQTLPIRYYDANSHGDLMSRYTNDADALREMLSMTLPQFLSSVITIAAVTFAMLSLSISLSIVVFASVLLMLWIVKFVGGRAAKHFMQQQQCMGELNGYIEEMVEGQRVVKVFCHEDAIQAGFDARNERLGQHVAFANRLTNMLMPILMNIGTMQYVVLAFIGGYMAINGFGGITLGTIATFLTLSKSFSAPIGQLSIQINAVIMALAGAGRIFTLMDETPEVDEGYVTLVNAKRNGDALTECAEYTGIRAWKHPHGDGRLTYTELKGDVRLFDVDFGYTTDKLVLNDVSVFAKPGEKIAFVGATGAGKTTITNLVNRFYDIADGKIRFDGININKIKKADLRHTLGIVLQDTHLFTGSIADNIRYGRLDATREDITQAAKLANAHDFIMRLPNGYDTVITGDGGNLSGGQRQLLSIARAAVSNPPMMILDEATSSIDTRTESIVQAGMDQLMEGRTVFVIAHRLSTIQNAEAIMVMEQGRIIERGNHEALLHENGTYYRLYTGTFAE